MGDDRRGRYWSCLGWGWRRRSQWIDECVLNFVFHPQLPAVMEWGSRSLILPVSNNRVREMQTRYTDPRECGPQLRWPLHDWRNELGLGSSPNPRPLLRHIWKPFWASPFTCNSKTTAVLLTSCWGLPKAMFLSAQARLQKELRRSHVWHDEVLSKASQ